MAKCVLFHEEQIFFKRHTKRLVILMCMRTTYARGGWQLSRKSSCVYKFTRKHLLILTYMYILFQLPRASSLCVRSFSLNTLKPFTPERLRRRVPYVRMTNNIPFFLTSVYLTCGSKSHNLSKVSTV